MKIFVSYSRRDSGDIAEQIYESLKDEYNLFTDIKNIQIGDIWSNIIEENITACDIFIVIVTSAALRSPEVEREVLLPKKKNKKIIPCFYIGINKNQIKWELEKLQGIKFTSKYELARDIDLKIHEYRPKPEPRPEPPQGKRPPWISKRTAVVAFAIFVGFGSLIFLYGYLYFFPVRENPMTTPTQPVDDINLTGIWKR